MFSFLLTAGLVLSPPATLKEAEARYGKLNDKYELSAESQNKYIIDFDFRPFGLDFSGRLNKDMAIPLSFVLTELSLRGLIYEITEFKGCFNSRPVKGTNVPSIHAFGLGCDFNHKKYSPEFIEVWTRWNFNWGGYFCSWSDYMHFSYAKWETPGCRERGSND